MQRERENEQYKDERDLELGEEADVGVEQRNGIGDLDDIIMGGNAAEEDAVDGGGFVLEGMEDKLYVRVL